jgi:hypothetical protein
MLNYSNTINYKLFDFKLVITIIKVYNLINLFSLNILQAYVILLSPYILKLQD